MAVLRPLTVRARAGGLAIAVMLRPETFLATPGGKYPSALQLDEVPSLSLRRLRCTRKCAATFPKFGVNYDVLGRGSAHDLFDGQLDVLDLLREQHEVEWVIISNGTFTSFPVRARVWGCRSGRQ